MSEDAWRGKIQGAETGLRRTRVSRKAIPYPAKYKNKWAVTIFGEWKISRQVIAPVLDPGGLFKGYDLHKVEQLSTSIEEMDAVTLNYWLNKFVMEVAKKSGERYPPRTIYGIVCGIRRLQGQLLK